VDLQLAYLATPQNAAVANAAQQAPVTAQEAAQAVFAAQLERREESVEETPRSDGAKIRADDENSGNAGTYSPKKRKRSYMAQTEPDEIAIEASGEKHFIDTTA
jgi:cation transport regulator ChaC